MNITFFGAAREVTGSCSLLETNEFKILIDCGMFQGSDFNEGKNSDPLPFDTQALSAVIVTHAHLDHTGRLPLLVKGGFAGYFYATPATIELTQLILEDALSIMEYNHRKFGSPILYDTADIAGVIQAFKPIEYHEEFELSSGGSKVKIKFYDAGHIFGSAFVEINAVGKRVIFSGDIGNVDVPILRDTDYLPSDVDALVCESTYGDRLHESDLERRQILENEIIDAMKRGGTLMIPSFSLERTQELLYDLNELIDRQKRLPRVPIFLDSPLAIHATAVYRKYTRYYDEEAEKLLKSGDDLFHFPGLTTTLGSEESKRINQVVGPKIIIAGAGMMNGGRILHHAIRYLSDVSSTLLIIGYQAHGTLGRKILDKQSPVEVMKERVQVKCHVRAVGAFSAHGDQEKLMDWIGGGKSLPKKVYLNHGEPAASESLQKRLIAELGIKTTVVDKNLSVKI
ncbi:MAG: MBL fold metallo-hydrolase [Candidatus Magasanikbacteria bacterium]